MSWLTQPSQGWRKSAAPPDRLPSGLPNCRPPAVLPPLSFSPSNRSSQTCIWAERQVHGELDRLGLRVVANREFFRGSPGDIIRIIQAHAALLGGTTPPLDQTSRIILRARLLAEADRHYHGTGDTLQDIGEAARLFEAAANAGSTLALERLGVLYLNGPGPARTRRRRAMRLLKQGSAAGNYFCMAEMATLFAAEGHVANFQKAWDQVFDRRAQARCDESETPGRFALACRAYIAGCLALGLEPRHHQAMATEAKAITFSMVKAVEAAENNADLRYRLAPRVALVVRNAAPAERRGTRARCAIDPAALACLELGKRFFLKKEPKTFCTFGRSVRTSAAQGSKSFLLLFFKKEVLPRCPCR